MSLWNDYEADMVFERENPHGINGDEWVDKYGNVHKLKDMSTQYIKNVMSFLDKDEDFYYSCKNELISRGETMMNYKEALQELQTISFISGGSDRQKVLEAVQIAMDAIEKRMPKKPNFIYMKNPEASDKLIKSLMWHCPSCGLIQHIREHHCICGQTIDWSEE